MPLLAARQTFGCLRLAANCPLAQAFALSWPAMSEPRLAERARERMARPAGLEPATPGLGNRCSILLSYGRGTLNSSAVQYLQDGQYVLALQLAPGH